MALYVLHVNDINLRIYRDNEVLVDEPGIAHIGDETNNFGKSARNQVKQHPRQVNCTYWHRMNLDPLGFTGPRTHNHADLLYQQINGLVEIASLGDEDELVIAVRSNTSNEQLSLLLGVCQESKAQVRGLVDVSAALLSMQNAYHNNLVLDAGLQSLTVAEIALLEDDEQQSLQKTGCSEFSELGLLTLMDAWLAIIADRFVSDARFDPLRIADTEQQVFDQLYDWLTQPDRPFTLNIEVQYETVTRSIEISESVLIDKASQRYDLLLRKIGPTQNIWLTETTSLLPGLKQVLVGAGHTVTSMESVNIYQAVFAQLAEIVRESGQIQFVTALTTSNPARASTPNSLPARVQTPTHILHRGFAVQLNGSRGMQIGRESFQAFAVELPGGTEEYPISLRIGERGLHLGIPSGSGWLINDKTPGPGQELFAGDKLCLDREQLEFIRVEDGT